MLESSGLHSPDVFPRWDQTQGKQLRVQPLSKSHSSMPLGDCVPRWNSGLCKFERSTHTRPRNSSLGKSIYAIELCEGFVRDWSLRDSGARNMKVTSNVETLTINDDSEIISRGSPFIRVRSEEKVLVRELVEVSCCECPANRRVVIVEFVDFKQSNFS